VHVFNNWTAMPTADEQLHNARSILCDFRMVGAKIYAVHRRQGMHALVLSGTCRHFPADGPSALAEELHRVVTEVEQITNRGRRITKPPEPRATDTHSR
jgi:hypothetical protein